MAAQGNEGNTCRKYEPPLAVSATDTLSRVNKRHEDDDKLRRFQIFQAKERRRRWREALGNTKIKQGQLII